MVTVSSVTLGGLQVVALLAAVVVAGARLLINSLEPTAAGSEDENYWLGRLVVFGAVVALIFLSGSAILFIFGLMSSYGMPTPVDLAFLSLLAGLGIFTAPITIVVLYKWNQGKIPSIEPP